MLQHGFSVVVSSAASSTRIIILLLTSATFTSLTGTDFSSLQHGTFSLEPKDAKAVAVSVVHLPDAEVLQEDAAEDE